MDTKIGNPRSMRWTILFISTLSCFVAERLSLCSAQTPTNSIKAGQARRYSDKLLVSTDGRFQLGFFNVSHSTKGFLGIRYNDAFDDHMVWVANRDTPFNGVNATLLMDSDGLLKIVKGDGDGTIPVNVDGKVPNSTATLENSGNLVMRSEANEVVWESFDHPTDTLLPGMKLGSNHVSKKKWVLTSWLSEDNPGTGAFTLEYNHSGRGSWEAFVVRRRGNLFSKTGQTLVEEHVDGERSYFSDETETFFNLTAREGTVGLSLRLNPDGRLPVSTANESSTYINYCDGGINFAFKCAGTNTPTCRSGNDAFVLRGRLAYNATAYSDGNSSVIVSDCMERCVRDCSCVAFSTLHIDQTGCNFWGEGARFELIDSSLSADIFVLNSSYPISGNDDELSGSGRTGSGNKWWIWVVISAMALMV